MATDFPLTVTANIEDGTSVSDFLPSQTAGETAVKSGELVFLDTADGKVKRCGADPTLILGVCEGASEDMRVLTPDGRIPIRTLRPNAMVRMCSATTPVRATHEGVAYGIVRLSSGNWAVDTTDTSNTRVVVRKVNPTTGEWFVQFTAANLQLDAIAS